LVIKYSIKDKVIFECKNAVIKLHSLVTELWTRHLYSKRTSWHAIFYD